MKRSLAIIACLFFALAASAQIPAYSAADVMQRATGKDTIYIINFWATWCVPCVQELPEFNKLEKHYEGQPAKVLLVSLDFKDSYPYKLQGFLDRKHIAPEVVWLRDTDPNQFIPVIEKAWQGSIPATLILQPSTGRRKFIEGSTTAKEVSAIIDSAPK